MTFHLFFVNLCGWLIFIKRFLLAHGRSLELVYLRVYSSPMRLFVSIPLRYSNIYCRLWVAIDSFDHSACDSQITRLNCTCKCYFCQCKHTWMGTVFAQQRFGWNFNAYCKSYRFVCIKRGIKGETAWNLSVFRFIHCILIVFTATIFAFDVGKPYSLPHYQSLPPFPSLSSGDCCIHGNTSSTELIKCVIYLCAAGTQGASKSISNRNYQCDVVSDPNQYLSPHAVDFIYWKVSSAPDLNV